MRKRKIPVKSSKEQDVIGIRELHEMFMREKRRYHPSLFCVGEKTKKNRKEGVSYDLFKKIVVTYLKIYFFDFYTNDGAYYFPLGGLLKKVRYAKWVNHQKKGQSPNKTLNVADEAIGLYWYLRASPKMFYMVTLKKLTGKTNRLPKIEKFYKDNFNKDLLPIFKTEIKNGNKHKTLYRNVF